MSILNPTASKASPEQLPLANALPIELVSFSAERRAPAVQLNWRTATDRSNTLFDVERSADGQAFECIGKMGAPTLYGTTDYSFGDYSHIYSFIHFLYYRLRQVDEHGSFSYSPVRVVLLHKPGTLVPYPNPARGSVTVAGAQATAQVELLDALGHRVAMAWATADGYARLILPDGLAAGMYAVRSGSLVQRLTVE